MAEMTTMNEDDVKTPDFNKEEIKQEEPEELM